MLFSQHLELFIREFAVTDNKSYCSTRRVRLHAHAQTHSNKFTCAIYRTREIIVFSLLVLLLYISRKKLFIKGFFIEDYVNEI